LAGRKFAHGVAAALLLPTGATPKARAQYATNPYRKCSTKDVD
jgi:hypothetical protein